MWALSKSSSANSLGCSSDGGSDSSSVGQPSRAITYVVDSHKIVYTMLKPLLTLKMSENRSIEE